MSFRTYVFAYLAGGLTFLPLLCGAVITAAWFLLPKTDVLQSRPNTDEDRENALLTHEDAKKVEQARQRQESFGETAASGTFAVLRQYDFQAAISALNARSNGPGSSSSIGSGDPGQGADNNSAATGESVYQSMYRSVFIGNRNASATSLLHNDEGDQSPGARRKATPASVMHIILRHGHLMLYDSPAHVDVKHVISLAHHEISLQADKDGDDADETKVLEADLFTKRTAIVLTPVNTPNGAMQQPQEKAARPFYLFSAMNIDKEDFYHALLYTRALPPTPRPLDTDALIKLQSALHSSLLTPETRAFNALLGRIFLGIHRTDSLVNFVRSKIERKLGRIQKPSFIPIIEIRSLDIGDAAPVFSNLKLRDLNISGGTTVSADVRYTGSLSITLLAVARLDLGSRFKARTVDLVLRTSLSRVSGTMLMHIKSAPTNRTWFCFESMPELEIRVEPVVSERKITYGFVLRAIEDRVRTAFGEGLVKPNWDDIPMPLQNTRGSHARGGLWLDDGGEAHIEQSSGVARDEKTMSMPSLSQDTGLSTGLSSLSDDNITKLRHAATMPVNSNESKRRAEISANETATSSIRHALAPKTIRSPSIISMSPSVAMNDCTVEPVRSDDASLRSTSTQRTLWRTRGTSATMKQRKDALEGLRDLRARDEQAAGKSFGAAAPSEAEGLTERPGFTNDNYESEYKGASHKRHFSESSATPMPSTPRSFSIRSTDSDESTAATSVSSARAQQLQQKKATILAAAGAATNAARTWGWNTYQKNKGAFQRNSLKLEQNVVPTEPIGRGQPLPPPGQPLPGPNKGLWGGMGSMRRKPVPNMPRPEQTASEDGEGSEQAGPEQSDRMASTRPISMTEDEFGNWHENSGDQFGEEDGADEIHFQNDPVAGLGAVFDGTQQLEQLNNNKSDHSDDYSTPLSGDRQHDRDDQLTSKKIPPPLPARHPQHETIEAQTESPAKVAGHSSSVGGGKSLENDESVGILDASSLRVPEYEVEAVAAENATPSLAQGAADMKNNIDEARGLKTEVIPSDESKDLNEQQELDRTQTVISPDDATHSELKRTSTDERFVRGEDVTEVDFEPHIPSNRKDDL